MISTITLNPTVDKTVYIAKLIPNDTNRVTRVEVDAGGKGINCSRMLKRLGAETKALAFLGGKTGDFVESVLTREEIPIERVSIGKSTRTCIAIEETSGTPPTTLNERGGPVEHGEMVEMLDRAKLLARQSAFVCLGGSVPSGVNPDIYRVLIQIIASAGAKAVLDADGDALSEGIAAKPFMIKPNLDEAERLLGKSFESKGDVARAAIELHESGIPLVVISLGKQGAIACGESGVWSAIAPEVVERSSIGSGDSMIAGVLHALESGADLRDALALGCAAGAATAMSDGADIGEKTDVDDLLAQVSVTEVKPSEGRQLLTSRE